MDPPDINQLFELPSILFSKWTWMFAGFVGIFFAIRSYFRGPQYLKKVRMVGKVVVVTGATSGIGKVLALDFAHRGAKVYIGCRNKEEGASSADYMRKDSRNKQVHYLNLDLASLESVRKFASAIKKKEDRIDILVNNAGVMCCPKQVTKDGFDYQFSVNYLGHFLLTHLLLPLLKAAPEEARILCYGAPVYRLGNLNLDDINMEKVELENESAVESAAYGQSKLAVMLFVNRLARELEGSKVTVNALHPGISDTEIHRHMSFKKSSFLRVSLSPMVWYFMKSEVDGAQVPIFMSVDDSLKGVSGKYYSDMQPREIAPIGSDTETADALWEKSLEWTGLKGDDSDSN